mgnify:CR=1 FL=1
MLDKYAAQDIENAIQGQWKESEAYKAEAFAKRTGRLKRVG